MQQPGRATINSPKSQHISPVIRSLHWLKVRERIQYKILSITYNAIQFEQPAYIHKLLTVQSLRNTRSSNLVTLQRPTNPSRLKVTDRSFYFHAPVLWNSLPPALRQISSTNSSHPVIDLSPRLFHSKLKTYLFSKSHPPD